MQRDIDLGNDLSGGDFVVFRDCGRSTPSLSVTRSNSGTVRGLTRNPLPQVAFDGYGGFGSPFRKDVAEVSFAMDPRTPAPGASVLVPVASGRWNARAPGSMASCAG